MLPGKHRQGGPEPPWSVSSWVLVDPLNIYGDSPGKALKTEGPALGCRSLDCRARFGLAESRPADATVPSSVEVGGPFGTSFS